VVTFCTYHYFYRIRMIVWEISRYKDCVPLGYHAALIAVDFECY
jgi:hypothetical protein